MPFDCHGRCLNIQLDKDLGKISAKLCREFLNRTEQDSERRGQFIGFSRPRHWTKMGSAADIATALYYPGIDPTPPRDQGRGTEWFSGGMMNVWWRASF